VFPLRVSKIALLLDGEATKEEEWLKFLHRRNIQVSAAKFYGTIRNEYAGIYCRQHFNQAWRPGDYVIDDTHCLMCKGEKK